MTRMITQHLTGIEQLCRQHSVKRLVLFGSAARDEFDRGQSDLDFFVEFHESDYRGASDRYFGLLHGLEDLFECPVDLVEPAMVQSRIFREVSGQHTEEIYNDATAAQAS